MRSAVGHNTEWINTDLDVSAWSESDVHVIIGISWRLQKTWLEWGQKWLQLSISIVFKLHEQLTPSFKAAGCCHG
jgi:hypothetical protein